MGSWVGGGERGRISRNGGSAGFGDVLLQSAADDGGEAAILAICSANDGFLKCLRHGDGGGLIIVSGSLAAGFVGIVRHGVIVLAVIEYHSILYPIKKKVAG